MLPLNKAQRKTRWEAGRLLTEPATLAATVTFSYGQSCCTLHHQSPNIQGAGQAPPGGSRLPPMPADTSFPQKTGKGHQGAATLAAARALAACSLLLQRVSTWAKPRNEGSQSHRATCSSAGCATQDPAPATAAIALQSRPGQAFPPHGLLAAPRFSCSPSGTRSGNQCPSGRGTRDSPEKPRDAPTFCEKAAP